MSFINCHYDHRSSTMHVWEKFNGERVHDKIIWVPYVYVKATKSDIKSIDGDPVMKREFSSYRDYYEFCKDNTNIFENKVKPEIQFLAERYHKIPDDQIEVPKLQVFSLDIEVATPTGFPEYSNPIHPISLISIKDIISKKTVSFGWKEDYVPQGELAEDDVLIFKKCKNEAEMLERFFVFAHKANPDVYTGWNVYGFDFPYLIERTKYVFGEDTTLFKKMSPINNVRIWKSEKYGDTNIDIAGIHILDYLDVYKWYSPNKLERYSLEYVSQHELGEGKLDYSEYIDIKELYEKNFSKYIEYNVIDNKRVIELEEKLGYIKLIQALSLLTKCPMKYYQAMTSLIEGALLTHFRRNNLCAPFFAGGQQERFPAAYVKEPEKGFHNWVIDIDITSSYPSHIITLNMSNETFYGRIIDLPENQIVESIRIKKFPEFFILKDGKQTNMTGKKLKMFNMGVKKGIFAIAPCGSVFMTQPIGVIAEVERHIFYKRVDVKDQMKKMKTKASKLPESNERSKLEDRAKELFSLQWAIKIILNAMFGITSVPYSRYFNKNIAEAITSCGRHTIKQGEVFVNEYLNEKAGTNKDWVAYIDTDSLFIKLGEFFDMQPVWSEMEDDEKIETILKFSETMEEYVNNRIFEETQLIDYNSQIKDFKIMFKQEIVAKTFLAVKKKKYAYWIVNDEGVPADKLKVKGLEIVRSDSAEAIRTRLKEIYEMILKGADDDSIVEKINKYKNELKKVAPEEIAANIGINNIEKYVGDGIISKGTPWHVKGAANYRMLLKEFNLTDKYEDIYEGLKAKVVYIKPNKFSIDVITFNIWPKEFDQHFVIDYEEMIDKFFLKKIGFLLKPMKKSHLLTVTESAQIMDCFFK